MASYEFYTGKSSIKKKSDGTKPFYSFGTARIESNDTTMIISDGALRMDRDEAKHPKSSWSILVVDHSLTEGVEMVYESSTHILT